MNKSKKWFLHWNLHGGRQMAYDSAVNEWPPLKKKDYAKLKEERMRFSNRVSPWRYYARVLGALDTEKYGQASPSLLLQLSKDWSRLGAAALIGGPHVALTPGKWRWRFSFSTDAGVDKKSFARLILFDPGKPMQFLTVNMAQSGKAKVANHGPVKSNARNIRTTIRNGKKAGWKELEMTFDLSQSHIARPMAYIYTGPAHRRACFWMDDVKLEKISER